MHILFYIIVITLTQSLESPCIAENYGEFRHCDVIRFPCLMADATPATPPAPANAAPPEPIDEVPSSYSFISLLTCSSKTTAHPWHRFWFSTSGRSRCALHLFHRPLISLQPTAKLVASFLLSFQITCLIKQHRMLFCFFLLSYHLHSAVVSFKGRHRYIGEDAVGHVSLSLFFLLIIDLF